MAKPSNKFWCTGGHDNGDGRYWQPGEGCPCGSNMQHIHCEGCGGLVQVG